MKKIFVVVLFIAMVVIGSVGLADTPRMYNSAEDMIAAYKCEEIFVYEDVIRFLESLYDEDPVYAIKYMREKVVGLKENEEGLYYGYTEYGCQRLAIFVYNRENEGVQNLDKEIIRVIILHLI